MISFTGEHGRSYPNLNKHHQHDTQHISLLQHITKNDVTFHKSNQSDGNGMSQVHHREWDEEDLGPRKLCCEEEDKRMLPPLLQLCCQLFIYSNLLILCKGLHWSLQAICGRLSKNESGLTDQSGSNPGLLGDVHIWKV